MMNIGTNKTPCNPFPPAKDVLKDDKSGSSSFDIMNHYSCRMEVVRFVAMASVVWGHCMFSFDQNTFGNFNNQVIQSVMLQLGKLGTIMFFIMSGYFISGKIKNFNVVSYLRYRMFSLILPWFTFLMILMVIQIVQMGLLTKIFHQNISLSISVLCSLTVGNIFHSTYWFIPVSIFSAIILIIFKNYTGKLWFGLVLAAITIFYGVNLYHGWIPANHTKAFLGYAFFSWLGIQFKTHIYFIKRLLDNLSNGLLLSVITLLFTAACVEGVHLCTVHSADPYASIRISNSLLSIALFIAFLKSNKLKPLISLKPQSYIFGVYLVHCIVIVLAMPLVNYYMGHMHPFRNMLLFIIVEVFFFTSVFTISYLIVYVFKKTRSDIFADRIHHKAVNYKTISVV